MYEFSYDKVASLNASELHDNLLFLEATLKNEIEKKKTNIFLWKTFLVEKNATFCIIICRC